MLSGWLAGSHFLVSVISVLIRIPSLSPLILSVSVLVAVVILLGTFYFTVNTVARATLISLFLGQVFGFGAVLTYISYDFRFLGFYLMIFTFFHISEYVSTAVHNPQTLSMDSFLINHSKEYAIAAVASWIEYSIEYLLFPSLKSCWYISIVGVVIAIAGEALRKIAMFTAGSNFTHNVQFYKRQHHVLVTNGIYKYFRHPSYVGWFYWSMGTQLVLCNPICLVGYVAASWSFFKDRIQTEEELLIHFFKKDYLDYQQKVGTGLPFIRGYIE